MANPHSEIHIPQFAMKGGIMVKNSFDKGPEGWCSYDYHASIVDDGVNVFVLAVWARAGGVNDSGYIWTNHRRWSADVPESPVSILPLIFYQRWVNAELLDLREAEVSVYLRGDGLQLHGARCYFWVLADGTRWHYTGHPLAISDGQWAAEPNRFTLHNDEALWHRSWAGDPRNPWPLDRVLGQVESYGFSFVGFAREVSGRLCMDEFEIRRGGDATS
jgi:hypothetical protein